MTTPISPESLKQQILELLQRSERTYTKNQLAKALSIRGDQRVVLKAILKELEAAGALQRGNRRRLEAKPKQGKLEDLIVAEIYDADEEGDLWAKALDDETLPPIHIIHDRSRGRTPLGVGTHVLIQIAHNKKELLGTVLRRMERIKRQYIGIFTPHRSGGHLAPCHRKDTFPGARLTTKEAEGLTPGDIVSYSLTKQGITINKVLGKIGDPKIFSLLAIHAYDLPFEFSLEAIKEAEAGEVPPLEKRTDFRHLELVTIDGEDARDFDDAVWAVADDDPRNPGGWRIIVAIADVAYYVRLNSALDKEARLRGNSVYFPDRVVPMLPEALSNELCSLKPGVDRACIAIEMIISSHGKIKSHKIKRGLMRSQARLTYRQVQNAINGTFDATTEPLRRSVIEPLYGAFQALLKARHQRGTLELDLPERQIILNRNGTIQNIITRERFDSHKLIEEFMIAANVAAAKTLIAKNWTGIFRIHDTPDALKIANLRQFLKQMKLTLPKAPNLAPQQFNQLLSQVQGKPYERLVSDLILRTQSQARYSPKNIGHYGLSLSHYAHFTSPIRRYSDLVVHRALISALNLGSDGYPEKPSNLDKIADHISRTERQAALAEREVIDRYAITFMAPHVNESFPVTIVGVNRFGLFVEVNSVGAQGFLPKSNLGPETFYFEEENHRLVNRRSRKSYQLGGSLTARLLEANALSSNLIFTLAEEQAAIKSKKKTRKQKR